LFKFGGAILNYCSTLKQYALPAVCLACSARAAHANLCEGCRRDLPYLPDAQCPRCAVPSRAGEICGACLANGPHFDRIVAPCAYAFPLDRLIQSFKYSGNLAVAPLLTDLLMSCIPRRPLPDLIIPMPLSNERLRERGFNQSLELARLIAARTGVAVQPQACARVRHSVPQTELKWTERAANIRNAFVCVADVEGCSVAVVDDVLTSGATMNEMARVLKGRGASHVSGWIAARTLSGESMRAALPPGEA